MAEEQVGIGQRLWSIDNHYTLHQVASFEEQPLLDQPGNIFDSLVDEMAMGMADNDLVHFVLQSRSLDYPISLPFMLRHELNTDKIISEVQRVLQSN